MPACFLVFAPCPFVFQGYMTSCCWGRIVEAEDLAVQSECDASLCDSLVHMHLEKLNHKDHK